MKINYKNILNKNMLNVFKDVLLNIEKNGLQEDQHLYITFKTSNSEVNIPKWLKDKHPGEMTIVIQFEYWNFKIKKKYFNIGLSFNNIRSDLEIPFSSVVSFADPSANFGLRLIPETLNVQESPTKETFKKKKGKVEKNNIIDFKNYKKN